MLVNCTTSVQHATGIGCNGGTCTFTCQSGYQDCDGKASNGCEINTASDPAHCGSCGIACMLPNTATDGCAASTCTVATCSANHMDCDAVAANGCECNGSVCCAGSTCAKTHSGSSGGGNAPPVFSYYDCYALGTPGSNTGYNAQMAQDAANADSGQAGSLYDLVCGSGTDQEQMYCKTTDPTWTTGTCTCWVYNATGTTYAGTAGHVYASSGGAGDAGCACPLPGAATWN
jgi:hypothetical protein